MSIIRNEHIESDFWGTSALWMNGCQTTKKGGINKITASIKLVKYNNNIKRRNIVNPKVP